MAIFGLPIALIGSAFGAITGFLFKRLAMQSEIVASERKHNLDAMVAVAKANSGAVKDDIALLKAKAEFEEKLHKCDPHRSETRRWLAMLIVICFCFAVPAMVLFGDMQWFTIHYWTQTNPGFFGIGRKVTEIAEVVTANGIPLAWLEGLITFVGATVSFYMGGSFAKYANPYTRR